MLLRNIKTIYLNILDKPYINAHKGDYISGFEATCCFLRSQSKAVPISRFISLSPTSAFALTPAVVVIISYIMFYELVFLIDNGPIWKKKNYLEK